MPVSFAVSESPETGTSAISVFFQAELVSGPDAVLEPATLMFPAQLVSTNSTPQSVLLNNSGTITLSVTGITASGDFTETNTCGSSLAPGTGCTFNVSFKPVQGGPLTGKLSVTDDAPASPQTVSLTGTGTVVEFAPTSLRFGCYFMCHLVLGCHCYCSGPETTMLTNVGRTALDIRDVMISGPFSLGNACRANLGPRQSCGLTVDWQRIFGTGEISVSDNGGASPQTAPLWGIKHCTP